MKLAINRQETFRELLGSCDVWCGNRSTLEDHQRAVVGIALEAHFSKLLGPSSVGLLGKHQQPESPLTIVKSLRRANRYR